MRPLLCCSLAGRSPGRRAWPRRRRVRAARPSADSLLARLRVGFVWRGPCAALHKAACAEGASGASFGRCAPPATGGRAVPPRACSVDRAGRRRRSATASAASRCSTLLQGGQPLGSVRDVFEAAVALHRKPRRVARGMRGAALGPDSARECPRWASRRGASAAQADASSAMACSTACKSRIVDQTRRSSFDAVYAIGLPSFFLCL